MYKFCFTINQYDAHINANRDFFCITTGVDKETLQKEYGKILTDEECYNIILNTIPKEATGIRELSYEEHVNKDRKYRNAWCDVTPDEKINIDMNKAKEIAIDNLRFMRQKSFEELGFKYKLDSSVEEALVSPEVKNKLEALRNITEPLKLLEIKIPYDDDETIEMLNQLSDKKLLDDIVKGK